MSKLKSLKTRINEVKKMKEIQTKRKTSTFKSSN